MNGVGLPAAAVRQDGGAPGAVSGKEIVMLTSRSLVVIVAISVSLAVLVVLTGSTAAQTVSVVHTFTGNGDAAYPGSVTLAQGRDGNLYGTTEGRATTSGEVFRLTALGTFSGIPVFDGSNASSPLGGVMLATDGNFYGTTTRGGSANEGVFFKLTPKGVFSTIHEFTGSGDGAFPEAPPIEGSDGNLYGTTGGSSTAGSTIYRYDRAANFTTLLQLQQDQGTSVITPLVQGTDGNLYGVASQGGATSCGSVFKMTTQGALLFLRSFPCGAAGSSPNGPLIQATDGNFYGTAASGGTAVNQYGIVFRLSQNGVVSRMYSFQGPPSDGATPLAGLLQATDGGLYGVTDVGGAFSSGTLFRISTSGAYTELHSFTQDEQFSQVASLMQYTDGTLYGTSTKGGANAFGTVYSVGLGLGSFITFVLPSGKVGQSAQILSQGLTGTSSVTFNGVSATNFTVASDTYMTAVVPGGATTGNVVVTTPGGTLTSNVSFRIIQ